jgi:hypothetical protein
MTAIDMVRHQHVRPVGIDRLALRAGLALVAWGRRSSNRPALINEDVIALYEWEREDRARQAVQAAGRTIFLGI